MISSTALTIAGLTLLSAFVAEVSIVAARGVLIIIVPLKRRHVMLVTIIVQYVTYINTWLIFYSHKCSENYIKGIKSPKNSDSYGIY